jgi:hypothetical protein
MVAAATPAASIMLLILSARALSWTCSSPSVAW